MNQVEKVNGPSFSFRFSKIRFDSIHVIDSKNSINQICLENSEPFVTTSQLETVVRLSYENLSFFCDP
jgi:hypothetical protein